MPRQSRPFDLAVRWDCKLEASQATIEVQEPKLALRLEGPPEVLYGKKELYRLKLSNSGNGAAENVMLTLAPMGTGENRPVSHRIASLAAGEQRVLEVELTARETGTLTIQADIKADGGAHAELAERVLVRRAALQIDVEGPTMQYVGAGATYRVCVRNPGNAPAKNVRLSAAVPPGGKCVSSSDGGQVADGGGQVQWTLESLEPGVERVFTLKCSLGLAGPAHMAVSLSADEELTASAEAITRVEAMADLRLDVKEPDGPIPVGEEAVYEVHVRNRGTKDAADVQVFAYFSQGIEPTAAEGGDIPHSPRPGRV